MADKTEAPAPDLTPVQARYLGDTPVVFPHLADIEREGTQEAYEEWVKTTEGINPRCLVNPGDVITVDAFSGEGRTDLEVIAKPQSTTKPKEA